MPEPSICPICNRLVGPAERVRADLIREPIALLIRQSHPEWLMDGFICLDDLARFRLQHVRQVIESEKGELSKLEAEVMASMEKSELLTRNVNAEFNEHLTTGQRMADRIADFGGSWAFISTFFAIIIFWMALNSGLLLGKPYDPYPFILLNLVLSCLAAVQAPVIMMSQNRQEAKDRLRSEHDYRVNLKAEVEIRQLNEKMDHLLLRQWQRLLEIQQMQVEQMAELSRQLATGPEDTGLAAETEETGPERK